ncbi:MAG: c-type cytochrome [Acidobacteriota bacterium]|nr:c-type cytochrome [Acidobacteriota bacterium]
MSRASWLFLFASVASAQNAASPKLIAEGQKAYLEACAACHGPEAEGSDRAPRLAASRRLRTRSVKQLRSIIHDGIPSSGMPSFHVPPEELDALTTFVQSLNSTAAETFVPGNVSAGEQFFFGKGGCNKCHSVRGRGSPIGPDLSNVARELTVSEIEESLLDPDSRITPGYGLVTVRLRGGHAIRGFARGRTNFDIQLQDLGGGFHMLRQPQIAAIEDEKKSLMPPVKAGPEEL